MPYELDTPVEEAVKEHRTDETLGFITYNEAASEHRFTYVESDHTTMVRKHWSINIINEFPYLETTHPWVVYTCDPEKLPLSFNELTAVGQCLHVYNWDIWTVEEKKGTVAVVTSYEIY